MHLSKHAESRMHQRAIPGLVIDLVLKFGTSEPAGNGAEKLYLDKRARRKVMSFAGPLAGAIEPHLDVYVLVGTDGHVITTAHRLKRINRH